MSKQTAGQRARTAAKKVGRLQISAVIPVIEKAAHDAAEKGLFHVDVLLDSPWFMDKTNQRDLRRFLRQQDLFAVNPRLEGGRFAITICWGDFPPDESLFREKAIELPKPVILVINGTANTGLAALEAFREYRHLYTIRATSRKAATEKLLSDFPYVQWLRCDNSAASYAEVTRGVAKVFYIMPPVQNRVELARDLAAALKANNVASLVHVSLVGCEYRAILFANQVRDSELIFEESGVAVTHLRCVGWFENLLQSAASIKKDSVFYQPWGDGAMASVSVADVGRAAARLLTRMGAEGVAVELTGPESLGNKEMAAILSEELGRPITAISPPIEGYVQTLKSYGLEDWFAVGLGELNTLISKGMASAVSPDGPKLLGKMVSFREFVRQNKAAFL